MKQSSINPVLLWISNDEFEVQQLKTTEWLAMYNTWAETNKTRFHTIAFGNLEDFQPSGTLNMTRAVQPLLYLTLNRIGYDYRSGSRKTYCIVYAETWNIFEIENNIGKVLIDE